MRWGFDDQGREVLTYIEGRGRPRGRLHPKVAASTVVSQTMVGVTTCSYI